MDNRLSKAINRVKWAYLLIYVHITIGSIDLLADWAAYIMIAGALTVIGRYEPSAELLKPLTAVMVFAEMAGQVMTVLRFGIPYIRSVLVAVVYTYLHFQLITNIFTAVTGQGCSGGWLIPLRNMTLVAHTVYFLFLHLSNNITAVMLFGTVDLVGCICLIFSLGSQASEMREREEYERNSQTL